MPLEIIQYSKRHGVTRARREYEISDSVLRRWLDRYEKDGAIGLENRSPMMKTDLEVENEQLRRELKAYKEMLAEKELALRIKDELLKKSLIRSKND
ncbi:MAG: helix-turn-helix domain-containing protein [Saprospiraceae bacterium]